MTKHVALVAAALLLAAPSVGAAPPGDPVHGKTVYQSCMGCHSLDEEDVGPRHRGVVGRVAGSVPDYAYSPALRNSRIVWNRENLDRWLANPQALVPGTKMFFAMPSARDRADVIAYLAQQREQGKSDAKMTPP